MLSYLSVENNFVRAFGNRSLLLFFLCVITRTADIEGTASALGISVNISQGLIVVLGPILALMLMASLKLEADNLLAARASVVSDREGLHVRRVSPFIYGLFVFPAIAALFFVIQFYQNLVPADAACPTFDRLRYFWDFFHLQGGFATRYCIRDITKEMPWIYPPLQLYLNVACTAACAWLGYRIGRDWTKFR